MLLHVTSWDMAGELGQMRSSGTGGGSRNTCFRLLVDSCTKTPLDENAPEKTH